MSFAPMSGGTMRFPKPARIGIETRKIIVVPCIVNSCSYVFASTIVGPGYASSVRIRSARTPAMRKKKNEFARYRIPISWWLVVVNQRKIPIGAFR